MYFQWTVNKAIYGKVHRLLLLLPPLHPAQGGTSQARCKLSFEPRLRVLLTHVNRWLKGIPAGALSAMMGGGGGLCRGVRGCWALRRRGHSSGRTTSSTACFVCESCRVCCRGVPAGWEEAPSLTSRDGKASCNQHSAFCAML